MYLYVPLVAHHLSVTLSWYAGRMERQCEQCAGRMPLTLRAGARFCSNACRQKSYRARTRRGIPVEMTRRARWVRHDENKVPLTLFGGPASVVDPRTWTTYAKATASTVGAGLGIVLGDGLGCIDLDHAIEGGRVKPWALEIIREHRGDTILVERSRSGEGIHIFLPMAEGHGRKVRDGERCIEIYSRERYIAVTGDRL